ncbi:MAG: IS66 family insertion sequence element accessory protein TnpA [Planctomycetota bacterium]|jgi:hypothetical protein
MSRLSSPSTAELWAERIAQCERSNLTVAQFCKSIGCSVTSFYQWNRKLAASPKQSSLLRVQTSEPTKDSIEIKLPSGISILVPVSAVDSISAILNERKVPGTSEQRSHQCQQIIPRESGTDPEDPLRITAPIHLQRLQRIHTHRRDDPCKNIALLPSKQWKD